MWTPDQIVEITKASTELFVQIGGVIGGVVIVFKTLHNNKEITINANNNASNSVPADLAHKLVDNAAIAQANSNGTDGGTTVKTDQPVDVDIKSAQENNSSG